MSIFLGGVATRVKNIFQFVVFDGQPRDSGLKNAPPREPRRAGDPPDPMARPRRTLSLSKAEGLKGHKGYDCHSCSGRSERDPNLARRLVDCDAKTLAQEFCQALGVCRREGSADVEGCE